MSIRRRTNINDWIIGLKLDLNRRRGARNSGDSGRLMDWYGRIDLQERVGSRILNNGMSGVNKMPNSSVYSQMSKAG